MLLSHSLRLCTLLPTLISASTQDTDSAPAPRTLPNSIQRAVPACAQPCLQTSLFNRFPLACTSPTSLDCLCSHYSTSGESLGEVALGCIYASCSAVESTSASSAYNICLGQEDAVPQTQTAITVTVSSTMTTQSSASSTSLITSKLTSTLSSTQSTTFQSFDIDSIPSTSVPTSSPPTSSATTEATTAAAPASTPAMKPAQIAGLAVAAAAAFIVAIGLMALSVFLRRRKQRRQMEQLDDEKPKPFPPVVYSRAYPNDFPTAPSTHNLPKQFLIRPVPRSREYSPNSTRPSKQAKLGTESTGSPPQKNRIDPGLQYAPARPAPLRIRNSSNMTVPLEQIGLAISAEEPGNSASASIGRRPSLPTGPRQKRPQSFRFTLNDSLRPDSTLSQGTVFEEDATSSRRRSSRLLPTPPIPMAPIRSFQPSRPAPVFNLTTSPTRTVQGHPKSQQQPDLSLNIPPRHSRSMAEVVPPNLAAYLAPPAEITRSTSISSSDVSGGEDIPDYYFTAHGSSPKPPSVANGISIRPQQHETPKTAGVRPKVSSSTVSRTPSKASTNFRDSISSQTSFESVDSDDPTPEDEDDTKQLSPVAESPISMLRYPKVPRASNQLVPRSPRSPKTPSNQGSPRRLPEPSALLVKRLGERQALKLEGQFHMDSPWRPLNYKHHTRSSSMETANTATSQRPRDQQTRVQSGQWPRSPAMYDTDAVRPLNIRSKRQQHQQEEARDDMEAPLQSPAWVPNITPTRQGDDLFLSVTYSKPVHY